jgi:formylglycine-generating enzyme required for sulfatase activity
VDRTPLPPDPSGQRDWFVQQVGDDFFTFIVFAPGTFLMGSPESEAYRQKNERQHPVRITRPVAVADREVTRAQFERFVKATGRPFVDVSEPSPDDRDPVVRVTWFEAARYCHWLTDQAHQGDGQCYDPPASDGGPWPFRPERSGYRLPTEAEWEYACRAGTVTPYSFGSDRELLGRYGWHLHTHTEVGGRLRPNLRGLYDMHGNVWEWCHDWYDDQPAGGDDPQGPAEGLYRALRGGGWDRSAWHCRSAYRHSPTPDYRGAYMGFRLVRTLK